MDSQSCLRSGDSDQKWKAFGNEAFTETLCLQRTKSFQIFVGQKVGGMISCLQQGIRCGISSVSSNASSSQLEESAAVPLLFDILFAKQWLIPSVGLSTQKLSLLSSGACLDIRLGDHAKERSRLSPFTAREVRCLRHQIGRSRNLSLGEPWSCIKICLNSLY